VPLDQVLEAVLLSVPSTYRVYIVSVRKDLLDFRLFPVVVQHGRVWSHCRQGTGPSTYWSLQMSATRPAAAERARQAQLRALEAQFYEQFAIPGKEEGKKEEEEKDEEEDEEEDEEDEEDDEDEKDLDEDEDAALDDGLDEGDFDDDEDLLLAAKERMPAPPAKPARRVPETVIFTDPSTSRAAAPVSKQARKQFMVCAATNAVLRH